MKGHQPLALAAVAAAAMLTACGAESTGATSGPTATSAPADAKAYTITVDDLAGTGANLTVANETATSPNSMQRTFASPDKSLIFEVDVLNDGTADKAKADYPQLDGSAKAQVPNVAATTHPSGYDQSVMYTGDDGNGNTRYGEAWQRGAFVVVILGRASAGADTTAFSTDYGAITAKQDVKIPA